MMCVDRPRYRPWVSVLPTSPSHPIPSGGHLHTIQIERIIGAVCKARTAAKAGPDGQPEAKDRYASWPYEPRKTPVTPIVGADTVGADTRFILVRTGCG